MVADIHSNTEQPTCCSSYVDIVPQGVYLGCNFSQLLELIVAVMF
jgi:hypothetical protein